MQASRVMGSDKLAELSAATPTPTVSVAFKPTSPAAAVAAAAKFHRVVHALGGTPATAHGDDPQTLLQSFRRNKQARARLLRPLTGDDDAPPSSSSSASSPRTRRIASPRKIRSNSPAKSNPLPVEQQSLLARLDTEADREEPNNRQDDRGEKEIATLARVHALVASPDEIDRWITTYETEKAQFASFALFTELKLDEIHDKYVEIAHRPNAVEAAACCATLLKMPGLIANYRTLLEKVAVGLLSVVYLPQQEANEQATRRDASMATLVRGCFRRTPYFLRVQELELELRDAKSLTDPHVLRSLSVDEITRMVLQIPVRSMSEGIVNAFAVHVPHLDHLLARVHEKKLQLQLEFYKLHGRRRGPPKRRSNASDAIEDEDEEDEEEDWENPEYPVVIPLTSSPQICRAITQHAASFSTSGKEMVLCAILDHIEIESFKDVYKRFDAHAKMCFLHSLSLLDSSDHLQHVLDALPNAGEMLFRFYYGICGGGGSGRPLQAGDEEEGGSNPKHVFFHQLLGPDMEFFFLCDLAAFLNDEQWTLLTQEYEKHALSRSARRQRLRRRVINGGADSGAEARGDRDGGDGEKEEERRADSRANKRVRSASSGSLEQFQTIVGNYLRRHSFTSSDIWGLVQTLLLPSLDETELLACVDHCMDHVPLSSRWKKLLAMLDEIDADSGDESPAHEVIRHARLRILKKLVAILSPEDRSAWLDKIAVKYGRLNLPTSKQSSPAVRKEPVTPVAFVQTLPPPLNLEDPLSYITEMRLETKMLWLETLLNAVATDHETSPRTALLQQTLAPFLNGRMPAPLTPVAAVPSAPSVQAAAIENKAWTLAGAEKAIATILAQFKQQHPTDEAALLQNLLPPNLHPKPIATTDRGVSPIPELLDRPTTPSFPPQPPTPVVSSRGWWEASGAESPVAKAFQNLLEMKSEAEVLALLRNGGEASNSPTAVTLPTVDTTNPDDPGTIGVGVSRLSSMKRKMSAVLAVAEPIAWQEFVKVGMLDQGTQTTDVLWPLSTDATSIDTTLADKAATVTTPRAPLTLSTLLGRLATGTASSPTASTVLARRKGDAKFQRLNNTAVPRAISGLITSWRVNTDQLVQFAKKSLPTVLRLIADAYGELLTAGRRKANQQAITSSTSGITSPRSVGGVVKELTLAQIVYQQFLHSYGLPGIADMHLLALSCALEAYRSQHLRVEFFSRFVFEEQGSKVELVNYLEFLECLVCDDPGSTAGSTTGASSNSNASSGPVTTKRQRFVPRIIVPDKENWVVPVEKAQEAAQLCFRAMRKQAVAAFCDKLAALAAQGPGGYAPVPASTSGGFLALDPSPASDTSPTVLPLPAAEGLVVNVDFLLQLVVDEWHEEQRRREAHLLNVFRAGDVNGDGELTSAEFIQIVRAIDATRDLGDILLMYSETLRRTQSDAIDAEHFLQVAKEYELDRAAWSQDNDLRNVVNAMDDLDHTWSHTKPFFLGTLEALAKELPMGHFLRVCEGAGCGCLKCILDGYVGFQRMRHEFASTRSGSVTVVEGPSHASHASRASHARSTAVSEALLWARFWHLMRQLYEAASESPGVLPASAMTPRPLPRFLKFRRMALPNFLFPDTARISGKVSMVLEQSPEAFDSDAILQQFATLIQHMSYTNSSVTGSSSITPSSSIITAASPDDANPQ